jgi:hypothetical protein
MRAQLCCNRNENLLQRFTHVDLNIIALAEQVSLR